MNLKIHQGHHSIGDFSSISRHLKEALEHPQAETLHLFPEMFLTGYPLADLCLQRTFIKRYLDSIDRLNEWLLGLPPQDGINVLLGGLHYQLNRTSNLPERIENVIFHLAPGRPMENIYSKMLLPNYDIFDEKKYFSPGTETGFRRIGGINIALLVCEDMWPSPTHQRNPVKELYEQKLDIDLVVNLSASPYFLHKREKRLKLARAVSNYLRAPLAFVNRVGGEDEILFDGGSFLINSSETLSMAPFYRSTTLSIVLPERPPFKKKAPPPQKENSWESLFAPNLTKKTEGSCRLRPLSSSQCAEIAESLTFGFQEYARKCDFRHFIVGLSGGVDSAVTLALIVLGMKKHQSVEAVFLPGHYTGPQSTRLAEQLCQNLKIPLLSHPIKFLHSAIKNIYRESFGWELDGLADENIQSRLRGALLYCRANQSGAMVVNTSNKSELAVGYSTLYGDSVGALSLMGDLYKSEVYQLAEHINHRSGDVIPPEIISRPPTAELRADQQDQDSLPPYHRLDPLLEGLLSYSMDFSELSELGFDPEEIKSVHRLHKKSEYKRKQFCPIIKVKAKSFGQGHRVPLTDAWE